MSTVTTRSAGLADRPGSGGAGQGDAGAAGTTRGEPPLGFLGQFLRDLIAEVDAMTIALREEGVSAAVGAGLVAAWVELREEAIECAEALGGIEVADVDLASVGLAGNQLDAKLTAFARARAERAARHGEGATFDALRGGARLVRRIGAKILGSALSILGENPRWRAVLEAVKELLELLDQAADEAEVRQHHAGPADLGYRAMLGYPDTAS